MNLGEASASRDELAEDEWCPPLADDFGRERDGARLPIRDHREAS
jgi:hypothetical protein